MDEALLHNVVVTARFEKYEEENRKPKLAVWRGKRLVIMSYQRDKLLEKISQLFAQIFYSCLRLFGLLKIDETKASALREMAQHFHLEQAQKYKRAELKNFEKEELLKIDEKVKEANLELQGYFEKITLVKAMMDKLEKDNEEVSKELNQIGDIFTKINEN